MALYRKYRPASFAEVVGQEHVTEPLSTALDSGRINHAYLFSGPRGCGKTSSARILARSLNCEQGPTSTPCGTCDSCVALAPGGAGTLDVTEMDAATHNGVDDMRELRERAFYAPAESRYRVFIIDEAHMISQAGFNALLKIVEEPPEHLIFIFATTEPEKLLQTIRSRTHNYPFRLLTPPAMRSLLQRVCADEQVEVEDTVYPLVIRAGGGSPRDSLSIMDQLLAGSGADGVTYDRAVALLGFTDTALIDHAVDALADQDQAGLFGCVSDVIDAGHDPRRFAMDLLDRFRDLLVIQAVPDAFDTGLVDAPVDQRDVLIQEAKALGQATLTRCAALVNEGLAQMRGATAPRLLLEILCARMALPAAGTTVEALAQRIEALEAGGVGGGAGASGAAGGAAGAGGAAAGSGRVYVRKSQREAQAAAAAQHAPAQDAPPVQPGQSAQPDQPAEPAQDGASSAAPAASTPAAAPAASATPAAPAAPAAPSTQEAPAGASDEAAERRSEAERAREIMRRRRQAASRPAASEPDPAPAPEAEPAADAADEAGTEPGPTPEPEPASEPGPESAPAPAEPAESSADPRPAAVTHPVPQWDEILEAVKEDSLALWVAARDAAATVGGVDADGKVRITLQHHTGALANYINAPERAQVFARVIEKVTGAPGPVVAHVGTGPAAGSSAASPAQNPAQGHEQGQVDGQEVAQEQAGKAEGTTAPVDTPAREQEPTPAPSPEPSPGSAAAAEPESEPEPEPEPEPAPAPNPRGSAVSTPASNPVTAPAPASPRPTANTRRTGPDSGEQLTGWRARKAKFDARQQNNTAPSGAASGGFGGVPLPEEPDEPWDDGSPSAPPPDPEATRQAEMAEAEEAMRERDNPEATNLDHRNALEIAGELLEQHLGAERTR